MKYIVKVITDEVISNSNTTARETMVRIDCFDNLAVYEQVASTLSDYFKSQGKSFLIKLSSKTFDRLTINGQTPESLSLKAHDWVADDQSITYYRNLHNSDILVLLGTENEDDTGGLRNFFEITPSSLVKQLNGDYAKIFSLINPAIEGDTAEAINRLYKCLFEFKPVDILKLSNIADDWANKIAVYSDFYELFFANLPMWDLPIWKINIPKAKEVSRTNVLRQPFKFISGKTYASLSASAFGKLQNQISVYNFGRKIVKEGVEILDPAPGEFNENWDGWSSQSIPSFSEFSAVLLDFIAGNNFEGNRKKLINLDFAIVQDVLNLKLRPETKNTSKVLLKVYGEPLTAFAQAILEVLVTAKNNEEDIDEIRVEFDEANITSMYSNGDGEDQIAMLQEEWKNICRHTNGVIEYINKWEFSANNIEIKSSPENFFDPLSAGKYCGNGKVKSLTSTQSVSKITFKVCCFKDGERLGDKIFNQDCIWLFTDEAPWLHNFTSICKSLANNEDTCVIPLTTVGKINPLIFAKSNEEFFDLLDESNLDFSFDVTKKFDSHNSDEVTTGFIKLGSSFAQFIKELNDTGLYSCLLPGKTTLVNLISQYQKLGDLLLSKKYPENEKWMLDAYIHSFLIEKNTDSLVKGTETDCSIVPPWHPSTLQKLSNQKVFVLDGCKEWWRKAEAEDEAPKKKEIQTIIDELTQMSMIQGSLDIMPSKGEGYYGLVGSFGAYSVYGRSDLENESRLKDMINKDAIFDDDFDKTGVTQMNDNAKMLYGVLDDYLKAFPDSYSNLSLVFVNPADLQPIVASIHKFVEVMHEKKPGAFVNITLKILVKPENKGGRNYLAFWMDEFFSEDEFASIKTYLNEWRDSNELEKLLDGNHDIAFVMNLLQVDSLRFIQASETDALPLEVEQCMFPIVYKPSPSSTSSIARKIELSQPQFGASFAHTQIVRYRNNLEEIPSSKYIAVRETSVDDDGKKIVALLHTKAYWVACIDSGLDGALLRNLSDDKSDYSIIGFSTGKGAYGQYNITITARKTILNVVNEKFKNRLHQLFHWDDEKIATASALCIKEASGLDGISLFSAINQKDQNIHEFMAYVLTSLREKKLGEKVPLKVIVHLDSYEHWFSGEIDKDEDESKSRPDFLILTIRNADDEKLKVEAKIVECKIAVEATAEEHKEKAIGQVLHGIKRLSSIFNPASKSVKKRYWYSQLYRALVFSQVTFSDASDEFANLSQRLRTILDGNFDIKWSGEILGYWLDMEGDKENVVNSNEIEIHDIPQLVIQSLLLGEQTGDFVTVDVSNTDEEQAEKEAEEKEKELEKEVEEENKPTTSLPITVSENEKPKAEASSPVAPEVSTEETPVSPVEPEQPVSIAPASEESKESSPSTPVSPAVVPVSLEDTRVLIGSSKLNEDVYWEFGHKSLANRHLLITGTSGQGKTYSIQTMLYELSKSNVSSVIFDYTEGFKPEQLEKEFKEKMEGKLEQNVVYFQGVPINPFHRHEIEVAGMKMPEKPADVATRFSDILTHVYKFGEQQASAIFKAAFDGITKYKESMDMKHFQEQLEEVKKSNPAAKTVLSKMEPFFMTIDFTNDTNFDWAKVLYPESAHVTVFQLMSISREMQVIITELMLWDAWYYTKKVGSKDKPFVVVLDEAQNLSHKSSSPSASILTEGRKFGWSAWFATQSLAVLDNEEITRLMQSAMKLYFKPTDDEMAKISKQIDPVNGTMYLAPLKALKKGQCIVVGERKRQDGTFGSTKPTITQVTAFDKRK